MSTEDQDYKLVDLPLSKKKVKLRNYTTGADEEAILELVQNSTHTRVEGDGADAKTVTEVDSTVQTRLDRLKITRFVIDIDGNKEGAANAVFELRSDDYHAVRDAVREITKKVGGLDDAKKKD